MVTYDSNPITDDNQRGRNGCHPLISQTTLRAIDRTIRVPRFLHHETMRTIAEAVTQSILPDHGAWNTRIFLSLNFLVGTIFNRRSGLKSAMFPSVYFTDSIC